MGKIHEALLKSVRQGQAKNSQASVPSAVVQHWRFWQSQKVLSERFLLGVCLGLSVCNMSIVLVLFGVSLS